MMLMFKLLISVGLILFTGVVIYALWNPKPKPTPSDLLFTRYFEECVEYKKQDINDGWSTLDLRRAYQICWGQAAMRAESKAYGHKTRPADEIPMVEVE